MLNLRWLALLGWLAVLLPAQAAPRLVAYYPFWASYNRGVPLSAAPVERLTHLVYAYAEVKADGSIAPGDVFADTQRVEQSADGQSYQGNYRVLASLKARNPQLKILLSMGGWERSTHFSRVFADPALRQNWVASVLFLQDQFGFDGVEIDWRFPAGGGAPTTAVSPQDWQSLASAMRDLRRACTLRQRPCEIATIIAAQPFQRLGAPWPEVLRDADFASLIAADFKGGWDAVTGHRSPLHAAGQTPLAIAPVVQTLLAEGVPAEKLVLQLSTRAMSWEGVPPAQGGLGQLASAPTRGSWDRPEYPPTGQLALADIQNWLDEPGAVLQRDAATGVPSLYRPVLQQFISFEDTRSLQGKLQYARSQGLGGVGFWDLSSDAADEASLLSSAHRFYYPVAYWSASLRLLGYTAIPWVLGALCGILAMVLWLFLLWRRRQRRLEVQEWQAVRQLDATLKALPRHLDDTAETVGQLLAHSERRPLPPRMVAAMHQLQSDTRLLARALGPVDELLGTVLPQAEAAPLQRADVQRLADYTQALQGQRSLEEMLSVFQRFARADERVDTVVLEQDEEGATPPPDGFQLAQGRGAAHLMHPLLGDYRIHLVFREPLSDDAEPYFRQLAEQILLLRRQVLELLGQQQLLSELFEIACRRDRLHFVQAERGYSGIHAGDLKEPRFITLRLRTLRQYFDEQTLLQVHRSYLVAPRAVTAAVRSRSGIALNVAGRLIPVSRSQLARVRSKYPAWFDALEANPA
ncbi:glycosyl hydrolase family 18 protein [Chitinilyticum litopenaei]|uniref:glycosyl hydrolase family 18 protein n=1 Tax=Chitinilyticum litopenaei TaxID=1121276 RepID=UPI00130EF1B0|nr:glycosyl hydrolase family 18 protein [Chitinilyticum litopenaei]